MTEYKVALDIYNGPVDLLLYLIRREEIDIHDIPIAQITEQYLAYVELLRQLDPEVASEFLVLAATLMEIKSRMLLPRPPLEEDEEDIVDPRLELVRQLLEYKKYQDVARHLDGAAEERALKHERSPVAPPPDSDEKDLESIDIWDLFDAFNRLLEQTGRREAVHEIGIDDTPIALHAEDITDSIERSGGSQKFEDIFLGRSKAEMIGLFLALLELIRQRRVRVSQDRPFGPILLYLLDPTPLSLDAEAVNNNSAEEAATVESESVEEANEVEGESVGESTELKNEAEIAEPSREFDGPPSAPTTIPAAAQVEACGSDGTSESARAETPGSGGTSESARVETRGSDGTRETAQAEACGSDGTSELAQAPDRSGFHCARGSASDDNEPDVEPDDDTQ